MVEQEAELEVHNLLAEDRVLLWGLGFEVWSPGFGVQGLGFRVWGSGFGV